MIDITVADVIKTSPKESAEVAFITLELIRFPSVLLKIDSHSFIRTDIPSIITIIQLNPIFSGFITLVKELLKQEKPTCRIKKDTTNADIYSNLPCPKGCSLSAGLSASLTPIKPIMEEAASDKLLKASAVTDILFIKNPIINFVPKRIILHIIPTTLDNTP